MPKSSWKAKRKTARTNKRSSKRALKAEARRSHSKETPRNQRNRNNTPINLWAGKLSSLFDVKPKGAKAA